MPKRKAQPKPTEDSPERIKECLSCELPDCVNCYNSKSKTKRFRKRDRTLNFFGEQLTINEIAERVGVTYKKVYGWNRYGGESWVEERAKKCGYKPKGE